MVSQNAIPVIIFSDPRHRSITTAQELWRAIARLGGYLDHKSDGPPGWQTLWKGVMDVLEGVHLAALVHPSDLYVRGRALARGELSVSLSCNQHGLTNAREYIRLHLCL
ncbi:IS4 family transposase [Ktedonobacter robiniae]|uniref:IS4 family transposase n=1 Tax=Ktedonobacter robiniae TaxID=2778365 RepID=UPI001916AA15